MILLGSPPPGGANFFIVRVPWLFFFKVPLFWVYSSRGTFYDALRYIWREQKFSGQEQIRDDVFGGGVGLLVCFFLVFFFSFFFFFFSSAKLSLRGL